MKCALLVCSIIGLCAPAVADKEDYIGRWALTIPGGAAGWLGVTQERGYLDAHILWGGGSVVPTEAVWMDGANLNVLRLHQIERRNQNKEVVRTHHFPELIIATVEGDSLNLVRIKPRASGNGVDQWEFTGKRIPPLPPKPDLSEAKYGEPIELFNGRDLEGWTLTNPNQTNGWYAEDGVLINDPKQIEGEPHKSFGNLRTLEEFEDFNLQLEVNVPPNGNSGVYLRGIYEVQVLDSYGKPRDPHHMGGVYSRIAPSETAEKPAGQWQTMDITLMDRHITVVLNGATIIDNEPLLGCTGGALWSDEFRPGPIYLQGDHTGVKYRNLVLRPIVN